MQHGVQRSRSPTRRRSILTASMVVWRGPDACISDSFTSTLSNISGSIIVARNNTSVWINACRIYHSFASMPWGLPTPQNHLHWHPYALRVLSLSLIVDHKGIVLYYLASKRWQGFGFTSNITQAYQFSPSPAVSVLSFTVNASPSSVSGNYINRLRPASILLLFTPTTIFFGA